MPIFGSSVGLLAARFHALKTIRLLIATGGPATSLAARTNWATVDSPPGRELLGVS